MALLDTGIAARSWRPALLAAGLCAAVYLPRLGAPLIWDDRGVIAENQGLDRPIAPWAYFTQEYFKFSGERSWRPLATLSYHAGVLAFGRSPRALRAFGLLLHGLVAWLLAACMAALGLAAAAPWGAALFLIHAVHTETLLCVAFNEELLCALGLSAMLLAHRRGRTHWALAAFACAMLAKETGALGLPLMLLHDAAFDGSSRGSWRSHALYAAAAAGYLYMRFVALPGPAGAAFALPAWERLYYAAAGLGTSARLFAVPIGLRIEHFAVPPVSALERLTSALGLLAAAAWTWLLRRAWRRERALAFLLAWPIPFWLLTSSFFPLSLLNMRWAAERWLYIPSFGIAAALGVFFSRRPRWGAALLALWAGCGWARALDWRSEVSLWESLARAYPWSAKAAEGIGEACFREGRYPEALSSFKRAAALRRTRQDKVLARYAGLSDGAFVRWESPSLERWLGRTWAAQGDLAQAAGAFNEAVRLDPGDPYPYRIMAYRLAENGDFGAARRWLERGLLAVPGDGFLSRLQPDIRRRRLRLRLSFKAGFY